MIDLNADLGEGFLFDEELMTMISSCNVACGGHTGNENSMRSTVRLAIKHKVTIGAHPSYPDPLHFGRKEMEIPHNLLKNSIQQQIYHLIDIARQEGTVVRYIKPHGALYNKANTDEDMAELMVDIVKNIEPSVALMGLSGSLLEKKSKENYLMYIREGFADRAYQQNGVLLSRSKPKALITKKEKVWHQVSQMIHHQKVQTFDDQYTSIVVDSICFHGDHPDTLESLKYVKNQLLKNKISIKNVV